MWKANVPLTYHFTPAPLSKWNTTSKYTILIEISVNHYGLCDEKFCDPENNNNKIAKAKKNGKPKTNDKAGNQLQHTCTKNAIEKRMGLMVGKSPLQLCPRKEHKSLEKLHTYIYI